MSKILINGDYTIEGKFSFDVSLDRTQKPALLIINGALETADFIDEVTSIENKFYKLEGIRLLTESYGSEDRTAIYSFSATDYSIKGE